MMIFSELYSAYYNTVASIISAILDGEHSERQLQKIVTDKAFGESLLTIIPALKGERWQLVQPGMNTTLKHKPTMPLTTLQKQWLKAISLDPRIQLFDVCFDGLEEVEPLFTTSDYHIYDRYADGDPFDDPEYIRTFRIVLQAIKNQTQIKFEMTNRSGRDVFVRCQPLRLEYSEKDDKFRIATRGCKFVHLVNLSRMRKVNHYHGEKLPTTTERPPKYDVVTIKIHDERNALERVMLHFAHFEKQAEKLNRKNYIVKIKYSHDEETDMVIRVLSFGPLIQVLEPESFRKKIVQRLKNQQNCDLK